MANIGISIGGDLRELGPLAARCEAAGFTSLWIPETARTAPVQASVAIGATERVRIGTNIALAFPRSPVITAMWARDLAEQSGGRFVLGLGTQVKRVNEFRYATPFEHPAPKMREVIEVCREVWASFGGEHIDHRGRFFTVTMDPFPGGEPPPAPIPVFVAGVNKHMIALAGSVCDGFLAHPLCSERYMAEVTRPGLAAGAEGAGRSLDDVEVVASVITSIADTVEEARAGAKMQIAFYGTTRTYRTVLDLHGFGDVVDPLRAAFGAGDLAGMIDLITDEMADTFAVAGTADEVPERVRGRFAGIADTVVLNPPWAGPDLVKTRESFDRLVDAFSTR